MSRQRLHVLVLLAALGVPASLRAQDTPHDATTSVQCTSCHNIHGGPGTSLTSGPGNANLCRSCHMAGGLASGKPMNPAAQAFPSSTIPLVAPKGGNSHRWNSGPAGHLEFLGGAGVASTGTLAPLGAYGGVYPKTYTLTVTSTGAAGATTFAWEATLPGGGSGTGLVTGANVPLDEGVSVQFTGASANAFQAGDAWTLQVRPGLRAPVDPVMAGKLENGQIMCSTCHDPHSQEFLPFDPAARRGGSNHFMRITNDTGQMCSDCHAARAVTSAAAGSHPVGVGIPAGAYKSPDNLPLDATLNQVQCQTCHQVHNGPTTDGSLLRTKDVTILCSDCHTLADTGATARHMSPILGVIWPGGQYGSTFPAKVDASQRGSCANCHQPHGWPDAAHPASVYPNLLVEQGGNLCLTCHDANGPATTNLQAEFSKASKHPLTLEPGRHSASEPAVVVDRHVDCGDCHNPHQAQVRANLPGPATAPRPAAGPLTGVRGVTLDNAEVNPAAFEYQICLRCHGDSPGQPAPSRTRQFDARNLRLQFNGAGASFHPVAVAGKSANVPSLINGWSKTSLMGCTACHNNNAGPTNAGLGPNGPHGSAQPSLLEKAYDATTQTPYSEAKYALCFKCHSAAVVMSPQSFQEHDKHVRGGNYACSVCHDPHGSSGNGRLINFDTQIVQPFNGKLEWNQNGPSHGNCTLTCHGEPHTGYSY